MPEPKAQPVGETASDLIIRMARENPGEITLCPVGPITNVAVALTRAPGDRGLLKEIVVMGSTIFHPGIQGIPTPMADANFWNDAEAAQIVLRSGAKITLVGMDVTMQVLLTAAMRKAIAQDGGPVGRTMMEIAEFYVKSYATMYPGIAGCGLHDPLAVAIAEDPSLATTERMCVDIELAGTLTRGQTVADRRRTAAAPEDRAAFGNARIAQYPQRRHRAPADIFRRVAQSRDNRQHTASVANRANDFEDKHPATFIAAAQAVQQATYSTLIGQRDERLAAALRAWDALRPYTT